MVEQIELLTRGGIYLARLDPAKVSEVGKIRPVVILSAQIILDVYPPILFICPLSRQSQAEFDGFHIKLPPRDKLLIESYALVEHCRAISVKRIIHPRLAQLSPFELRAILHRLKLMVDI
jgi:mRNA interferase MazF